MIETIYAHDHIVRDGNQGVDALAKEHVGNKVADSLHILLRNDCSALHILLWNDRGAQILFLPS